MNRRKFFTISSCLAPAIFIPKLISIHWKRTSNNLLVIPAWMLNDIEKFAASNLLEARSRIQDVAIESWHNIADKTLFEKGTTQYHLCKWTDSKHKIT